jgi:hypothetical protein
MKLGDLVQIKWTTYAAKRQAEKTERSLDSAGLVVDLGHTYWDGSNWTVAHAKVEWPDFKATWEATHDVEIVSTI